MMEEPSSLARWVTYFFASGDSAIVGSIGIVLVLVTMLRRRHCRGKRRSWTAIAVTVGLFLIACGSPALPAWYFMIVAGWSVFLFTYWIRNRKRDVNPVSESGPPFKESRFQLLLTGSVFCLLIGLAIELPFQIWWPIKKPVSRLMVIGDSVTAGLNDGEMTWPKLVPQAVKIDVLDASQPGATLRSARQQNTLFEGAQGLVILEIGGNDLLEGLPVDQFERHLDVLLSEVKQLGRTIVMFELPLPPLCARYGSIQRRVARRYQVSLIPKRRFTQVLTASGATVDGIHLSAKGQGQLARLIVSLFPMEFEPGSGTCRHLGP